MRPVGRRKEPTLYCIGERWIRMACLAYKYNLVCGTNTVIVSSIKYNSILNLRSKCFSFIS
jgi:hypothetical protein